MEGLVVQREGSIRLHREVMARFVRSQGRARLQHLPHPSCRRANDQCRHHKGMVESRKPSRIREVRCGDQQANLDNAIEAKEWLSR